MKKALIFDPYLDTLGGGERYCLTFALGLVQSGYRVEIAWPNREILTKAEERFGLDLSGVKINSQAFIIFQNKSSLLKRLFFTIKYQLIFWVSDGSLPFLFSQNNLVHFQIPFKTIGGHPLVNKIKTLFIHHFVYNSHFTQKVHDKHFPKNKGFVLYPPVDVDSFHPGKKEKIILSVARFDSPSHPKRQDILINAFKTLHKSYPSYQLFLAGGSYGTSSTLEELKESAKSLPVKFIVDPDFDKLKSLYSKAEFFWHAAGYEIDEIANPEKVEHFGITTVESMAAGCIPIVIGKGGQVEILSAGGGFLCADANEISEKTKLLIKDDGLYQKTKEISQQISSLYSHSAFFTNQKNLL